MINQQNKSNLRNINKIFLKLFKRKPQYGLQCCSSTELLNVFWDIDIDVHWKIHWLLSLFSTAFPSRRRLFTRRSANFTPYTSGPMSYKAFFNPARDGNAEFINIWVAAFAVRLLVTGWMTWPEAVHRQPVYPFSRRENK